MKEYGILKAGSIIVIAPPYQRGRNEIYEIVSFEKEINEQFNQYLAYKLNANRDKVIGAKTSIRFPKTDNYSQKFGYNYNYWLSKEGNGELVVSKDIEDSILQQQGTGAVLKYDGEKPTYLMTREEYKKYIKPFWDKVFDLPKKYPQYFYNEYGSAIITSEKEFPFLINDNDKNDYSSNWRYKQWVEKNKVEPKRIPAEIKKEYEEDYKLLREKTFNAYIDTNLKTNNKAIISKAIEDGIYAELIKKGQLNTFALKEILDSVKLKLPNKLEQVQSEVSIQGLTYEKEIENKENRKKFIDDIISYFQEYYDNKIKLFVDRKSKKIEKYLDFLKDKNSYKDFNQLRIDFSNYLGEEYEIIEDKKYRTTTYKFGNVVSDLFSELKYFDNGFNIKNNWKEIIYQIGKEKANFIFEFYSVNLIQQIPINIKSSLPKVIWGKLYRASVKGFDSELILEFNNGFKLNVKNETIYAGGYNIQKAHLRTYFHFSIDGKVRSDAEIQKAYKEFIPVKEKENDDLVFLKSKLKASQDLLDLIRDTDSESKEIIFLEEIIQVTKDLIDLI
jgi:hypothetical protein